MDTFRTVKLRQVCPDRNQPRKEFGEESLGELSESIKEYGLIEPLVVREEKGFYIIVAGERRWRASRLAGLTDIPVIIRDYSPQQTAEVSLIENVQREALNPIEEALGYKRLQDDFGLTQEQIAGKIGKSRVYVTNCIRLLGLPSALYPDIIAGRLTSGHARVLLGCRDTKMQLELAARIVADSLSVRETEKAVKEMGKKQEPGPGPAPRTGISHPEVYRQIETRLQEHFGCRVALNPKTDASGEIRISYTSQEELEALLEKLRYTSEN